MSLNQLPAGIELQARPSDIMLMRIIDGTQGECREFSPCEITRRFCNQVQQACLVTSLIYCATFFEGEKMPLSALLIL